MGKCTIPEDKLLAYLSLLCAASQHYDATHGELLMPGFSHDQLTRFLAGDWSSDELVLAAAHAEGVDWSLGWFGLDDTIGEKPYGPCIEGVYTVWSAKHDRYVRGITVVTLIWTDGTRTIPLGFRVWHKEGEGRTYKTKLELAKDLLRLAKQHGIWTSMIVFDSWYAAADFMRWCDRKQLTWVTRLKKNRLVKNQADWVPLEDLALFRKCWNMPLKEVGLVRIIKEGDRFYATNRLDWDRQTIVQAIRDRWPVERVYADTKDHLGFERCQARKLRSQEHHIACVLVAYLLLQDPTDRRSIEGMKHAVQWHLFKMKPRIHPVLNRLTA